MTIPVPGWLLRISRAATARRTQRRCAGSSGRSPCRASLPNSPNTADSLPRSQLRCYIVVMRRRVAGKTTQPFSIRLGEAADLLVREEGRRTGRSRSAVVKELAEEAAKERLFPGIAFRDSPRRAWVIGSGLDVWELVELERAYEGDEQALREAHPLVTDRHLRLARAYTERFPDEVQRFLEESRRPLEELLSLYPFLERAR